jgi:hypothetical protein
MLTRLGKSGVDVFTIMHIAGHSCVAVSRSYAHPTPEAVEPAFERLQLFSGTAGEMRAGSLEISLRSGEQSP